jgi:hypothetical protein
MLQCVSQAKVHVNTQAMCAFGFLLAAVGSACLPWSASHRHSTAWPTASTAPGQMSRRAGRWVFASLSAA